MKNTFQPQQIFPELHPEFKEHLLESFINPLNQLGFELLTYTHLIDQETISGTHILTFEHNRTTEYREHWVRDICTQKDDNQPPAIYSLYFGNLFLYIPYFG